MRAGELRNIIIAAIIGAVIFKLVDRVWPA